MRRLPRFIRIGIRDLRRMLRPINQLGCVFQNLRRHFVVTHRHRLPRLLINERPHAALLVKRARVLVGFEIKAAIHQEAKELLAFVKTMPSEHGFDAQLRELAQLIADEVFERIIFHAPRFFPSAIPPPPVFARV